MPAGPPANVAAAMTRPVPDPARQWDSASSDESQANGGDAAGVDRKRRRDEARARAEAERPRYVSPPPHAASLGPWRGATPDNQQPGAPTDDVFFPKTPRLPDTPPLPPPDNDSPTPPPPLPYLPTPLRKPRGVPARQQALDRSVGRERSRRHAQPAGSLPSTDAHPRIRIEFGGGGWNGGADDSDQGTAALVPAAADRGEISHRSEAPAPPSQDAADAPKQQRQRQQQQQQQQQQRQLEPRSEETTAEREAQAARARAIRRIRARAAKLAGKAVPGGVEQIASKVKQQREGGTDPATKAPRQGQRRQRKPSGRQSLRRDRSRAAAEGRGLSARAIGGTPHVSEFLPAMPRPAVPLARPVAVAAPSLDEVAAELGRRPDGSPIPPRPAGGTRNRSGGIRSQKSEKVKPELASVYPGGDVGRSHGYGGGGDGGNGGGGGSPTWAASGDNVDANVIESDTPANEVRGHGSPSVAVKEAQRLALARVRAQRKVERRQRKRPVRPNAQPRSGLGIAGDGISGANAGGGDLDDSVEALARRTQRLLEMDGLDLLASAATPRRRPATPPPPSPSPSPVATPPEPAVQVAPVPIPMDTFASPEPEPAAPWSPLSGRARATGGLVERDAFVGYDRGTGYRLSYAAASTAGPVARQSDVTAILDAADFDLLDELNASLAVAAPAIGGW